MLRSLLRLATAGLLLVPLTVAGPVAAGGGCHTQGSVHTEGPATVIRMDTCSFEPTVVHVPVGTEVRFLNTAVLVHIVTGERSEWGSKGELRPGDEFARRFDTAGVFPYSCPLHPGMVGAIVVGGDGAAGAGGGGSTATTEPATAAPQPAPASDAAGFSAPAIGLAIVAGMGLLIAGIAVGRRFGVAQLAPRDESAGA